MNDSTLSLLERVVGGTLVPKLLNLALLLALAMIAAQLTWHMVPIDQTQATVRNRPVQHDNTGTRAVSSDAQKIVAQHLFGAAARAGDKSAALGRYQSLINGCFGCHVAYKDRVANVLRVGK